ELNTFPILIDCREVNRIYSEAAAEKPVFYPPLPRVLYSAIGRLQRDFMIEQVEAGLKKALFCLIIDGLDELDPKHMDHFLQEISYFSRVHTKTRIVVTSRPMREFPYWSTFQRCRIQPLVHSQVMAIVDKLPVSGSMKSNFANAVDEKFFEANRKL